MGLVFLFFEAEEGESELAHAVHDDGGGEGRDGEGDGEEEEEAVNHDEIVHGQKLIDLEDDHVLAYE